MNGNSLCYSFRIFRLLLLIAFPLLLSGCNGLTRTEQSSVIGWETLSKDQTVGQTFVAKYDGLREILFYLSPQLTGNGQISLHLRSGPTATSDIVVSENKLSIDRVNSPGFFGFFLPVQAFSNQKYYYAFLEVTGKGNIQVGRAAGNTYLNGAMYKNGIPDDSQTTFQLTYSWRKVILGLCLEAITWIGILAVGFFLFVIPGWGLFSLLWPGWGKQNWMEKLGLSAGLSLVIYPLLLLWTDIIGLHLYAIYAWLPFCAGFGMILWQNRRSLRISILTRLYHSSFKHVKSLRFSDFVLLIVLSLLILSRFWVIRSLDVPMWGDSFQHTMIAQLLVDHGGLFTSWQPYAEMITFTYHFGFHAAVAVFVWLTHLDTTKSVLWVGQILNVMAVIALYPMAIKVGRSLWAGVVALLVAGLLSPMPMYYINWGRYTQLAGQVILPVVVWALWETILPNPLITGKKDSIGQVIINCLALGGLALTHYRIFVLAIIFLIILWILYARRATIQLFFQKTLWIGIGAGLLFLPWFVRIFKGMILRIFLYQMSTPANIAIETDPQLVNIGNISVYLPTIIWLLLIICVGYGLWKREKGVLLISLWWIVNVLVANPSWLGLPGAGAISGFAVFIAFYIPTGLIIGTAAGWIGYHLNNFRSSRSNLRLMGYLGAILLLLGLGIWGAFQRLNDIQPSMYALVTRPDIQAASWIQENTDPKANLLVNSFSAFNNYVIVGSDGGWWLPLLAKRLTSVPPINYGLEKNPSSGYISQINALTSEIHTKGIQTPDILTQLIDRNLTYIYVGQLQGQVNSNGPLFTVEQLISDPNFHLVYHQDRVWIFQVQLIK